MDQIRWNLYCPNHAVKRFIIKRYPSYEFLVGILDSQVGQQCMTFTLDSSSRYREHDAYRARVDPKTQMVG